MARDVHKQPRSLERQLDEAEANIRVLVEAELEVHHTLEPHEPGVPECPTCRRLGTVA